MVINSKSQNLLIEKSSEIFEVRVIKREYYNPNVFEEFNNFTDEERLIVVGEGRHKNMKWLILKPKVN